MDLRKVQSMDNVSPLLIHRRSSEKRKLSSASGEWNLYIEKSSMLSSSPTSCCLSRFSSSTGHIDKLAGVGTGTSNDGSSSACPSLGESSSEIMRTSSSSSIANTTTTLMSNVVVEALTSSSHHHHHSDHHHRGGGVGVVNIISIPKSTWVGYLSVLCLLVACKLQVDRMYYDPSSSSSGGNNHSRKQQPPSSSSKPHANLGAAALGSLTSVLSPILPFTGGSDLRKSEYLWGAFGVVPRGGEDGSSSSSSYSSQSSSSSPSWSSSTMKQEHKRQRLILPKHRRKIESRPKVIAGATCFVKTSEIAKMSLTNLTQTFRHAIRRTPSSSKSNSQKQKGLPKRMISVLQAMDDAASQSRGISVKPAVTNENENENNEENETNQDTNKTSQGKSMLGRGYGDIDALQFCAAMRLFAEWRILRQVPEGYKAYGMGMGLGHKDVVQNLAKIETAIYLWIEERREMMKQQQEEQKQSQRHPQAVTVCGASGEASSACSDSEEEMNVTMSSTATTLTSTPLVLRSPTLRELLMEEVDLNVHPRLPRLKENSAAMGLLWIRRQLQYQTSIFRNVGGLNGHYDTAQEAVRVAYGEVYGQYHGWAVQKIFDYSFNAAPSGNEIFRIMNPERLQQVLDEAANMEISDDNDDDDSNNNDDDAMVRSVEEESSTDNTT